MFFKRTQKTVNPRRQEAIVLVFLAISFLIYGITSLHFYLLPSIDPMSLKPPQMSAATLVFICLFFVYGVYTAAMHRSLTAKVFGITIALESVAAMARKTVLIDAATRTLRLSGAIEGAICFAVLLGILVAVRKGASIWR